MQRGLEIVFHFSPLYSLNPSTKRLNEAGFLLIGWVLMPEHFHVLLKPEPADSTPKIVKQLKQQTASHILGALREHEQHPWCDRMLRRLRLPTTVHSKARHRVWERRYYPFMYTANTRCGRNWTTCMPIR